ncbi:hypothetical protein [Pontibacter anaerobius]|uniref:DUF340 domain-containing protein n=1 Tax=Pontibacter anaerobius TaxID=2993940 RepID=A0ABT3RFY1_9BACT|nr:hypothetical protein [Pontibacter anaerobius]MCX2740539.1 hypothetical protein [Pontibacter anaerobius]
MTNLYKTILFVCGVFLVGLLMFCLRHDAATVTLQQLLPLVLLYGIGLGFGVLLKPVLE